MPHETSAMLRPVTLDDKWTADTGRVVINGAQAIARIFLAQRERDRRAGLNTAGYVTGYRGSPLGNVDTALWSIAERLEAADILFQPGVNEDMAATAVRGTQQIAAVPEARKDGVFAAWYGKGPGVDRSCDAFKHGNYAGTHPNGGVLVFYGDDHAGKSSTVAHQSEQAMASCLIPSLYPSNVGELLSYGLLGVAMSRATGSWIGIKCVTEIAEQTATIDLDLEDRLEPLPHAEGIHIQQAPFNPLGEEQIVIERRLPRVYEFIRANRVDRTVFAPRAPALAIVSAGKAYNDVRAALDLLGLDEACAVPLGIGLYKVGCIWPLEPNGVAAFASGARTLLVVEEKKSFLEQQIAEILINQAERPLVIGKRDEDGANLISSSLSLDPVAIAHVVAERLKRLGLADEALTQAVGALPTPHRDAGAELPKRAPYFCSGCPHNRSTRIPDGSLSMTGIGCHTMANFVRPAEALLPTQMGGEGGNWIGLAPFTGTKHMFQNMGDGTYYHSGLLAIRAAVASGVNITYKILYNDAVAMTGGQPVDGPISVAEIAHQVRSEGVQRIILLSDDPSRHDVAAMPKGTEIGHRETLDTVQRSLRETAGCSVLIYEQTCAAEKRRRRKRGTFPDPAKRLFIAKSVCEGCGDCSVQSTCVSLTPVETALGRKRAIDQSSCNKDYSCIEGFCPSFITVSGAEPRKPEARAVDASRLAALPVPLRAEVGDRGFNIMVSGIGGTGVVTVGALIGMAAHLEGKAMSLFDMTGLSQKNGAVFSHIRIAADPGRITTQRIPREEADLLLGFDLVAALAPEAADTLRKDRTRAIANADVSPTVAFQFDRDATASPALLLARLRRLVNKDAIALVDASAVALAILGDTIGANLFVVGVAVQRGWLPVGVTALEQAIRLNGVAVTFNLRAFALGRLFAADSDYVTSLAFPEAAQAEPLPRTLDEVVTHRIAHLTDYQGPGLADRYRNLVEKVAAREEAILPGERSLALTVARTYAKLLAYKDEYEVARLLTRPELREEIARTFADGGRISLNMAPPILGGKPINGRPRKREFRAWILPLLQVLARLRGLRGTMFDPFGRTAERRMERALIGEYEALVERTCTALSERNYDAAVRLLGMADEIRGFGPVKDAAVDRYHAQIGAAEAGFASPAPDRQADVPTREVA